MVFGLTVVRSVRLVAATRGTATTTVAAAVSTTPRRVATGRATVATAHGRAAESAAEAAATAARATTTTTSAAVHAGEVGALGDDLQANVSVLIFPVLPFNRAQHTFRFLLLNTLSLRTSACVTKLGSENST
jgi:hypothetical protein